MKPHIKRPQYFGRVGSYPSLQRCGQHTHTQATKTRPAHASQLPSVSLVPQKEIV